MKILMMIPGFLALTGLGLLLARTLRLRLGEGIFHGVSLIMLVMFGSGVIGNYAIGAGLICLLGVAGWVVHVALAAGGRRAAEKGREQAAKAPAKPPMRASAKAAADQTSGQAEGHNCQTIMPDYGGIVGCQAPDNLGKFSDNSGVIWWVLALVVLYGVVFFHGVRIQNTDELHLWGALVKQMESSNRLADWGALVTSPQMYAASFFQLFFQKLTGYSEQAMYASSFLMLWVGLLLPWAGAGRERRKTVLLYSLIMFFGLYTLYVYPYKTLYTDLFTAAWSGGLAGWWLMRDKSKGRKKQDLLVLLVGLVTLVLMKTYVGILMVFLLLLFLFSEKVVGSGKLDDRKFRRRFFTGSLICLFLLAALVGGILLLVCRGSVPGFFPSSVKALMAGADVSMEKAVRTMGALAKAFTGLRLSESSRVEVYTFGTLIFLGVVHLVMGWLYKEKQAARARILYILSAVVIYLLFLMTAFICIYTYEEAVRVGGAMRYFSILVIYLFMITLVLWLRASESWPEMSIAGVSASRLVQLGGLAVMVFFIFGVNDLYVSRATAFNDYQIKGAEQIEEASREVKQVKKEIGDDKVYFIDQNFENTYPPNVVFFHLGHQASYYMTSPWIFTEDGNVTRIQRFEEPTIKDLPDLLAEGDYQYLWVYDADRYLADNLPEVFDMDIDGDEMKDGQLFRVTYEDGKADGLELVKDLNPEAVTIAEELAAEDRDSRDSIAKAETEKSGADAG